MLEKLKSLAAELPNDNGDPPDTDYQRGYMAACVEAARLIQAIVDDAEAELDVDTFG